MRTALLSAPASCAYKRHKTGGKGVNMQRRKTLRKRFDKYASRFLNVLCPLAGAAGAGLL
jgi:hypothetical protein